MTLKHKAFSSVRWTTTAAVLRTLLQVAQLIVLARLLAPEDYGLMAMVTVVLSFAFLFADLGLNSAYMQRQSVTPEQRSSLFWLNIIMSFGLMLLVIAVSPLLAGFFGDERLTPLLMLSATTFVFSALGQQVRMTAEKMLNFRPVALVEIGAALLGFGSAVTAALFGCGVYALVLAGIVSALSSSVLAWIFVAKGWRPLWRFQLTDVRSYLGFGGAMVADGIFNNINRSMDLLLGGRMLLATQLGFYSVPRHLILQLQFMVNPIVSRVGFPLIAQMQHDIPRVRFIYIKILNMTASTNAPLYVGLAFFAPEIVHVLLGHNWGGSVDFLRILAIWGFLRSTGNPVGSLLLGMGRADLSMKWNFALLFIMPPVLWFGAQSGPAGLAWALLGLSVVMFIPGWFVLVQPLCHAGLLEYSKAALKPALISVLAIAPGFAAAAWVDQPLLKLVIGITVAVPLYLACSYKVNREWFNAMLELVGRSSAYSSKS